MRLPTRTVLLGLGVSFVLVSGIGSGRIGITHGFADPATPPAPPGYIPTPIGQPPAPPTPISVATSTPVATTVPAPTSLASTTAVSATPVASATVKPVAEVVFKVDAVRVSKVNNPGNFQGLASVKRGATVWLMLYFTVDHLPGQVSRHATYSIVGHGHTVYRVAYNAKQKVNEVGRFSRYIAYQIPSTLPLGHYTFHAILRMRTVTHSKSWKFDVGTRTRVATSRVHA